MNKKHIIAVEGIDGAGKSTLIALLREEFPILLYQRTKKGKWLDKIVSTKFMKKHYMIQVPIYLLLSYKNYISFIIKSSKNKLIIMDRCFLSNICYFYPKALKSKKILDFIMKFEIKLLPSCIFILDVDPIVGHKRDNEKKELGWMINTRKAYLEASNSQLLSQFNIKIVEFNQSIESKYQCIVNEIGRGMEW